MTKISIVGAGKIGLACAKILQHIGGIEVTLIDNDEQRLCTLNGFETRLAHNSEQIESALRDLSAEAVICATPPSANLLVAMVAARLQIHYIDFSDCAETSSAIEQLGISDLTFVPQTGLTPGLANYIGLSLFDKLGVPHSLDLRVGALPQVSFGPEHFAIIGSPADIISKYVTPSVRKRGGIIESVSSLSEEEMIVISGVKYEAFTTAGGIGFISAYDHIPSVECKTLRYPGHLEGMQKLLALADGDVDTATAMIQDRFTTTRDDLVVLMAHAVDTNGRSASCGIHFYPNDVLDLTALELTSAGTGVAVLELILQNALPTGVLHQGQIPFSLLRTTKAYQLIFNATR